MTFDPEWQGHTEERSITDVENRTAVEGALVNITAATCHLRGVTFNKCDFTGRIDQSSFTECRFFDCRFSGSTWRQTKFSACQFQTWHLTKTTFDDCNFLQTCTFDRISASGEEVFMKNTSISPSTFLGALQANLHFLRFAPSRTPWVTEEYQLYRFYRTRSKLAKMIYVSTKNEPDPELYFDAHKQLTVWHSLWRVEEARYRNEGRDNPPVKRNGLVFLAISSSRWVEFNVTVAAGFLTDWGKSLARAAYAFLLLVGAFSLLYYWIQSSAGYTGDGLVIASVARALDVSLVFGYTRYEETGPLRWVMLGNVIIGLFWYSVIAPVVVRRFLR